MLHALLKNRHSFHDFLVELLENSEFTFLFNGPWFTNMYLPSTVDPFNVHHILSKNFANYPRALNLGKSLMFLEMYHQKMAQSFLAHPEFLRFLIKKTWEKIEIGMIPVLDHASMEGLEIDLQDLFHRFTFDTICSIITDHDPGSLCINLPNVSPSKALDEIEEALLYRHIVPTCAWKFQRWLGVGQEKKHRQAWEIPDAFIYECISKKGEQMSKRSSEEYKVDNEVGIDLITLYMNEIRGNSIGSSNGDKFLRDTFLNFLIARRDTTSVALSWFFYLLSKNPQVLSKVKEELDAVMVKSD
ncbi:hypothetical protein Cgig2_024367 [Carnegiea gigantea]|uniref:Cytochrome P450 n=1 Tax=Carnegiea gigantea TaxID=171969 RepID=A0A9Q1JN82_9CARY|nr:hypothetical protein Cgig2_024367 [Carnegiea gigantea]